MKLFKYKKALDTAEYEEIQVNRSRLKFKYCRVSILDMLQKMNVVKNNGFDNGPILCIGVRNGREVNLVKLIRNKFFSKIFYLLEFQRLGFSSLFPFLEHFLVKDDVTNLIPGGVYGVELNPDLARKDVFRGNFDFMPQHFSDMFSVVFSNSFDHSINPEKTAAEWIRVIKDGGYLIFDWVENDTPTYEDPAGEISKSYIEDLFQGTVIYYSRKGNFDPSGRSSCLIIKIKKC
jgi:SAM-dependent methyltransferase